MPGGPAASRERVLLQGFGNVVVGNALRHNGIFGNPTNGDLADATVQHDPGDCFFRNSDASGALTTSPVNLDTAATECGQPGGGGALGTLGIEVACASNAFGPCSNGTGDGALAGIRMLAGLLHSSYDTSTLQRTRAVYPSPGNYVAPRPAPQPSMCGLPPAWE